MQSNTNRFGGLDLARFLAFVGMVIVNFKVVMGASGESGMLDTLTGALEGRAAATFVVLAGIGLGLAAVSKDQSQIIAVTLKRALFLLALGLVNSLIFEADILHYYAVYFLFGMFLLRLTSRRLVICIVILNLAFVTMVLLLNYDAGWNWNDYSYTGFWTAAGFLRNLFFNGWHPTIPWLGFLLFGIILSRIPLGASATQYRLMLFGICGIVASEFLNFGLSGFLTGLSPELTIFATTEPIPPMPLYSMAGMSAAAFMVGFCLRISGWLDRLGVLKIVIPAGRQTLTLYIAHILIGMGTLEALGMLGNQSLQISVFCSLAFCVAALVYALLWSRWFERGPIEAIMRRVAA